MARRGQRLEEQLAGAAAESAGARGSKRRGRFVKVILLSGVVAIVVRPQVRNRLLDALFGPEEQFDYESLTEPDAPAIDPDDIGAGWPPPAAGDDADDGPSWTFSNETDWGAAIAPLSDAHAQTQAQGDAVLEPEGGESSLDDAPLGQDEDESPPAEGPPTAFGVSSVQDVAPAEVETPPYRYDSREEDPPTPGAYAPTYEPPAWAPPSDEPSAYEAAPATAHEPPAVAYEPPVTTAYEPPAAEEPSPYEPPPSAAYEPPPTSAYEPSPYEPPVTTAYEPPAAEEPSPYEPPPTTSYEPPATSSYEPPPTTSYEPPPSTVYEPPATTPYEPPAPVEDDADPDAAAEPEPAGDQDGQREYDWGVPASESPVRPVTEASPYDAPIPESSVEAWSKPESEPRQHDDAPAETISMDGAGASNDERPAEEAYSSSAEEPDAPEAATGESDGSDATAAPDSAAAPSGTPETAGEASPHLEPAIGEAGPPPRGGWWLSRRRRGQSAAPEPPRWD